MALIHVSSLPMRLVASVLGPLLIANYISLALAVGNAPYLRSQSVGTVGFLQRDSGNLTAIVKEVTNRFVQGAPEAVARLSKSLAPWPSERHPFIFFHLRKAGGSTVRTQLVQTARKEGFKAYVACFDGVPCETYDPPQEHRDEWPAIYGGHFYYPSALRSLYLSQGIGPRVSPPDLKFDCLVMLRKPSARVQSCWNFRMVSDVGASRFTPALADMDAQTLAASLPEAMSMYGEGCNNEALRVLSNSGTSEEVINALTSRGQSTSSSLAPVLLEETLQHMQHCVVGVVERCEDTMRAVRGYLPWFSSFDCAHAHERKSKVRPAMLSVEAQAEVARENLLEDSVYDVANALLDAQLARLPAASAPAASTDSVDKVVGRSSSRFASLVSAVVDAVFAMR